MVNIQSLVIGWHCRHDKWMRCVEANSSTILTCQNLLFKSIQEKMRASTMVSMISGILGKGWASFSILSFRHLKSMQNLKVPSFFWTNMTMLHQAEVDGQIAPPSNISCKCWHTSSIKGGAICLNHSLKGSLLVNLMTCSVVSVQPLSFFSSENTLWNSMSNCLAWLAYGFSHFFSKATFLL